MRTFSQGNIDGQNSRCPGAAEFEVTCVAPVTEAGKASKAAFDQVGRFGELVVCQGRLSGPLPLLTGETYTLNHRQAAAQSDDA